MPLSSAQAAKLILARVPYLNCAPFFHGLPSAEAFEWRDLPPRLLGQEAEAGQLVAGPMALVDFVRLQAQFERLGNLGIAVRGRCGSALLFSRKPIRQLDGAVIAVTDESSTTACLLRVILERRYAIAPKTYERTASTQADALMLIGDEALRFRATNRIFPYEVDLASEWWLWQHLPFVFAVWAVRQSCATNLKQQLLRTLQATLAANLRRLDAIASERAVSVGMSAEEAKTYLDNFQYRLGDSEERGIAQFTTLLHEHHLL